MLRVRNVEGVEEWEYRGCSYMDFAPIEARLQEFAAKNWAVKEKGRWHFTPEGFLLSNLLIGDLLERQEESRLDTLLSRAREHFNGEKEH